MSDRVIHESLRHAVHAVMLEVGYVYKSGEITTGDRYSYASDADLIRALRPAMLRHGLFLVPRDVTHTTQKVPTARGGTQYLDQVLVTYLLEHVDSGDTRTVAMPGSGMDVREKGVYKALTGAYKYALRELFLIETGDDPEREEREEQEGRPAPPSAEEGARLAALGRAWVVRQQYARGLEGVDGRSIMSELKTAAADSGVEMPLAYADLKALCWWKGWDKPSLLPQERRARLFAWLCTPDGLALVTTFRDEFGIS